MQEKANELAKAYLLNEANKTIYVTFPDQAVYLNSDLDRIKQHCEEHNLTLVIVKGESSTEEKPVLETESEVVVKGKAKGKK